MEYQSFPQPEELKQHDQLFTVGANKSGRKWKVGSNPTRTKNFRNMGARLTWQQKTKISQEKQQLRQQIRSYKLEKQSQRKANKQRAKQRKRQQQLNQIRAGKFQVIKNTKGIKKWNRKVKKQLVKLPAEVFESLSTPK